MPELLAARRTASRGLTLIAVGLAGLAGIYVLALRFTSVERFQGLPQKIFYVHVPAAWCALLAFSLSFDDYVVTTFNAGVGGSTLPLYIYGAIKFGVSPEINAISSIIVAITAIAILIAWRAGAFRTEAERPVAEGTVT